jgi:hypothetical protein
VRFQDAARDGRAIVYQAIQADPLVDRAATLLAEATPDELVLARAAMNGESIEPGSWRMMFPTLFGPAAPPDDPALQRSEAILAMALDVAARGDEARSQVRGAIVEALAERLVGRRTGPVRRDRRILFDGVRSEIHPYDVTVERPGAAEAWDCKWGARGIGADVLHQLDDARANALAEEERLLVGLVVFDARRSCRVRLARVGGTTTGVRLVALETLGALAGRKPAT